MSNDLDNGKLEERSFLNIGQKVRVMETAEVGDVVGVYPTGGVDISINGQVEGTFDRSEVEEVDE